jgi:hypothetical protein
MPTIPEYTTGIVRRRATPNTVNFQAIDDAGATARGINKISNFGAEMAQKYKDADDATALNEAIIAKQKSDMEWIDAQRKAREGNPDKFAKDLEPEIRKRDDEFMKNLSGAAKRQFKPTADRINLQTYESNLNWENTRKTQIYASRIQKSLDDNNLLMLRAGMEGKDPSEYLRNVDAATVAAGGVFSAEKLKDINGAGRSEGLSFYLQGMIGSNPTKAKELLDSKEYDSTLGAGNILRLTGMAEAEIERKLVETNSASMMFANINDMQAMAGNNPTLQNKAAQYRKAAFEDPAGYVSQHPEIQQLNATIAALPPEAQAVAISERNTKIIEIQKQMGIPSYRQSLVPLGVAQETAYAMADADTSPDQAMQQFDQYMTTFAGNEQDAIDQLKTAGLKGAPLSVMFSMGPDTDKNGLMKAVKKQDELDKLVSKEDKDSIERNILQGIEGFSESISHLPGAVDEVMAYKSGADALAKLYVTQGMDAGAASKKALEETIKKNFHVIDNQVLIPAANNPKNVRRFLGRQEKMLANQKILIPPSVPEAVRKDYRDILSRQAIPRTVGNWIMFYDQTGNPILDENKVEYDEYGNIINAEDAAIRFSIDAADAMGGTK